MQVAFRPANPKLHEENIEVNVCSNVNYLNPIKLVVTLIQTNVVAVCYLSSKEAHCFEVQVWLCSCYVVLH